MCCSSATGWCPRQLLLTARRRTVTGVALVLALALAVPAIGLSAQQVGAPRLVPSRPATSRPAPLRSIAGRPPVPGAPAGVTAFVDVAVVPMDTDRVLPHQTVLVQGGRIAALGPTAAVTVPHGAERIDGRDQYLMPGLGTCHAHTGAWVTITNNFPAADPRYGAFYLFLLLADGVTVARNADYMDFASGIAAFRLNSRDLLWLRRQAAAGQLWSPRLYVAGQWAPKQYTQRRFRDSVKVWPAPRLDSIAAYVAAYKAAGYNFIKLHEESPEIAESVFAAARRVGIQVGGHVVVPFDRALAGGQAVADHLDHNGGWSEPQDDSTEAGYRAALAASAGARRRAGMWSCAGYAMASEHTAHVLRAVHDSSAGFLLGGDSWSGNGGLPDLVRYSGLTPYQVLVGGTRDFGRYLRTLDPHGDEVGTIAVGQRADLLLLTRNPLADIGVLANDSAEVGIDANMSDAFRPAAQVDPAVVMVGGRWLARPELNRRLAVVRLYAKLNAEAKQELRRLLQPDSSTSPSAIPRPIPAATRRVLVRLDSLHQEQRLALAQRFALAPRSPAGGADSLHGPQRLVALFARQLGAVRAALPMAARDSFDVHARDWLARHAEAGYRVTIPGVRP